MAYASALFYHIRSLRERGHRLPIVSVCAAALPLPLSGCFADSVRRRAREAGFF
ncbi:hypothetical protein [Methanimicrococcus hacksteinii]|uniref:hypothetical protein n=1 Tax=Methanimicrococcus hacksteinii TaxID=3028293 RepID=UPI00298EED2D|nr:hypothetical protein [Methanimicrococcus sp. At1]